jgi:hypothetical protein
MLTNNAQIANTERRSVQHRPLARLQIVSGRSVRDRFSQLEDRSPALAHHNERTSHPQRRVLALMKEVAAQGIDEESSGRIAARDHGRLVRCRDDAEGIGVRPHVVVHPARWERMVGGRLTQFEHAVSVTKVGVQHRRRPVFRIVAAISRRQRHRAMARNRTGDPNAVAVVEPDTATVEFVGEVVDSFDIPRQRVPSTPEPIDERAQAALAAIRGHRLDPDVTDEGKDGVAAWNVPVTAIQRRPEKQPPMTIQRVVESVDNVGDVKQR